MSVTGLGGSNTGERPRGSQERGWNGLIWTHILSFCSKYLLLRATVR